MMRKIILTAVAAFVIGGATTGALIATAQPAPPPDAIGGPPPGRPGPGGWGAGGWGHRFHGHHGFRPDTFALVYRAPDRNLSPADVQKIVEGFLLFRGNHTWKVTNVAPTADGGAVGFSLTTPEGSVIAKFTMDPHTGRVHRVG